MVDEMNPVNFKLDSFNFNVDHGYLEGIVKGFKSGILKQADYLNLTQCETLDGTYVGLRSENARIKCKTNASARRISTNAGGAVKTMCNTPPSPFQGQHIRR